VTKTRGFLHPNQNVFNATQNSLCMAVNDGEVGGRAKPAIVAEEPGFQR
jgi:hypothetical protein